VERPNAKEDPMHLSACRAAPAAALIILAACAESSTPLDPAPGVPPAGVAPGFLQADRPEQAARHERLARRLARALRDDQFRDALYRELWSSRVREGKIHLQRFLAPGSLARQRLAELNEETPQGVGADLESSGAIEVYLPVPAHRASWHGGSEILVATAESDREAPIAFDVGGQRRTLDPARPPAQPVIALGRAETDFTPRLAASTCITGCDEEAGSGGGTPLVSTPGLYMTYASFTQTFEGWLKGSPEFEVHILGQDGSSTAMKSYQCAGAQAGGPYQYDQNDKQWSGSVLLFSQTQLDAFKAAHPTHSIRVFLLEDDDGACAIKLDSTRVATLFKQLQTVYGSLTGGKDENLFSLKTFVKAASLLNLFKSGWSAITTQDDLVGNAIEDVVAREYFPGANWIVKGENTITNGAIRLEMR
jgi:hypothetical protein